VIATMVVVSGALWTATGARSPVVALAGSGRAAE
jgi:hypothetical protein